MKIHRQERDGVIAVAIAEPVEIDVGNAEEFRRAVELAIQDGTRVALDASRIEFFDSAGMAALLALHKGVLERGGQLVLAGIKRPILEIFRMVGFDVIFGLHPDIDSAVEAVGRDA
jgi:anti-sigma B factor antagonist